MEICWALMNQRTDPTGIFDSGNELPGGVTHYRHVYRPAQFELKGRALNLLRDENTP